MDRLKLIGNGKIKKKRNSSPCLKTRVSLCLQRKELFILSYRKIDFQELQRKIVDSELKRRLDNDEITQNEYEQLKAEYESKINNQSKLTTMRKQEDVMEEKKVNETMTEIEMDMKSIYAYVNEVATQLEKQKELEDGFYERMKSEIAVLKVQINNIKEKQNFGASIYYIDDLFFTDDQRESAIHYFTNRNGEVYPSHKHLKWNRFEGGLVLPVLKESHILRNDKGLRLANATTYSYVEDGAEKEINEIIDGDPLSYWSEVVQSTHPIKFSKSESSKNQIDGVMSEVHLTLHQPSMVNQIHLTSFSKYPMIIAKIEVITPYGGSRVIHDYSLKEKTGQYQETVSFYFEDIMCERIQITLIQPHYTREQVLLSKKSYEYEKIWEMAKSKSLKEIDVTNKQVLSLMDYMEKDEKVPITYYEYQYGISEIDCKHVVYQPEGVYVTKPFTLPFIPRYVQIETEEYIPRNEENDMPLGSIEYYIVSDGMSLPILPQQYKKIEHEKLNFRFEAPYYESSLLFSADGEVEVYKNGVKINEGVGIKEDGQTITLAMYEEGAVYTACYTPKNAYTIDFLEVYKDMLSKGIRKREEFMGTDENGRVKLSFYPYVNKEKINEWPINYNPSYLSNEDIPIQIYLIDDEGYHIEQPYDENDKGIHILNKTDYKKKAQAILRPYNEDEGVFYEYEVKGDTIQFNTVIPRSTKIVVDYYYLVSNVRLKIIMHRHSKQHDGVTPIISGYRLKFFGLNG